MRFARFRKKPRVRPESEKKIRNRVVTVDFSSWITKLKASDPGATIRVKRLERLGRASSGYLGEPIPVSSISASTFDRMLFDAFGGGSFTVEYWQNDYLIMYENSDPQMPVTHTINVAGEPKGQPGRKSPGQNTPQGKGILQTILSQLNSAEGIAAITALGTLARELVKDVVSRPSQSGVKDLVESVSMLMNIMPQQPDELDQIERFSKLQTALMTSMRPPVNVGGGNGTQTGSKSTWDGLVNALGGVIGVALANVQQNAPRNIPIDNRTALSSPDQHANANPPQLAPGMPSAAPSPAQAVSTKPAEAAQEMNPATMYVNAKILAIQTAMQIGMDAASVAEEIWMLLVYIVGNGVVGQDFVTGLQSDPYSAFDQIMTLYAPQSAAYPELDAVKQIVVGYILEEQARGDSPEIPAEPENGDNKIIDFAPPEKPELKTEPEADPVIVQGDDTVSGDDLVPEVRTDPVIITKDDTVSSAD